MNTYKEKRKTRKEIFLERMEKLIPWQAIQSKILPVWKAIHIMLKCKKILYNFFTISVTQQEPNTEKQANKVWIKF